MLRTLKSKKQVERKISKFFYHLIYIVLLRIELFNILEGLFLIYNY